MILKEYQKRTLEIVREFLGQLAEWRDRAASLREAHPEWDVDWVAKAWKKTVPNHPHVPRRNGLGQQLPAFCLKIPTGGGKTLLATKVIDLVNRRYLRRQTGLVLWIVPTTQIYNQTLAALRNRDHPYRQQLDMASAGKTLVLEKTSGFGPRAVAENLCVLLLMLPSANRRTKDQLRMFRDSGGFERFFPTDDDWERQRELLEHVPNLDTFEDQGGGYWKEQPKTSLGNTLRLLKPLIILDEGHKAYSLNAKATLEGFNPCMIVELSATPRKEANVLVDIRGHELNAEEMIKLDLNIRNYANASWKDTLLKSIEHRQRLEEEALAYEGETGVYIRPICVIQVERTGKQQRKPPFIHADDVCEYLMTHPGITREQVAVKTSAKDELKDVDEIGGLLSRDCPIRFIVTKQALQEGWDCPFAYVLTILTNPGSRSALTQLVGRILRQPYAKKTGVSWLDESYVFCFQRKANDILQEVRKGFGLEGLQDLRGKVVADDQRPMLPGEKVVLSQRKRYREAARELVLPAFAIRDDGEWRLVSYESDILSRVPWDEVDVSPLFDLALSQGRVDVAMRAGLDDELANPGNGDGDTSSSSEGDISYYFAASHLVDVMPNPWRGAKLTRQVFGKLLERYPRSQVVGNYTFILEEIRNRIEAERDRLSRHVFADLLDTERIRFLVVADDLKFNRLPRTIETAKGKQANREDGGQYRFNLFDRTFEEDLNGLENKIATYLDQQERLFFWYRNRARHDYYVQGWKRNRIFADFIFTLRPDEANSDDEFHQVFVVETKGIHLKQSTDTAYKRSVFDICTEHAAKKDWAEFVPAMRDKVVRFEVVDEDEWQQRLNGMLARG